MTLPNPDDLDMFVLACRPAELSEVEKAIARKAGVSLDNAYSDSAMSICMDCDRAIYVGPRQQQMIDAAPHKAVVLCMTCAVRAAASVGMNAGDVQSLGNPETP